ncbi:hypothetical protein QRD89_18220 [Halobacillus sp. ACCC02827]|uniref:hypothetical protein n=1 Tax=unclassified Halobacillus TaxID=2636472 RepID=UPI0002A4D247|nr:MULTISPECIES: hypothetical protein [unclassified Halobacillus]ELK48224.1 hypothetical protein D479_03478 [Halobacillus sp. BAB-2008]WJE15632.1 hypothetical protein QRD89_18220 [Halobacillus sp. ACCC02827]
MPESTFDRFLHDSFREGIYYRELRLSDQELAALRSCYPKATVKRTSEAVAGRSKAWYEVCLIPAGNSRETMRQENERLKRELLLLKQQRTIEKSR